MEVIVICIAAFLVAILTFFSGFGLGTILTPIFMLYFPVELAVALTGVVHFFNNIFKLFLVGKFADKQVLLLFGLPAVIAALLGSFILIHIAELKPIYQYSAFGKEFEILPVKFIIAVLLIFFAAFDLIPKLKKLQFSKNKLPLGGFLSGFFGGLSGNQGALRSAFLIKAGLSKEAFIGTAVVVSTFVDFTRLGVYASNLSLSDLVDNANLVLAATLSATAGAYIGNKLLRKITIDFIQTLVAILLIGLSIALGLGMV
ncbi:MAG: TSUP family transporter [Luteibaculaceae bacterium]